MEPKQEDERAWSRDRCPLCDGFNKCGIAAGKSKCWCFVTRIPDEVKDKIPKGARGVACVCEYCAEGKRSPSAIAKEIKRLTTR